MRWDWRPVAVVGASLALVALTVFAIDAVHDHGDYSAAVGAVATIISLAVTLMTYRALGLARRSADAAKEAADAARISAEGLHRIERAYVDLRVAVDNWEGNQADLKVVFANLGKTPAHVQRIRTECHVGEYDLPFADDFLRELIDDPMTLGADRERFDQVRWVNVGERYTVFAAIEYQDVFQNLRRTTLAMAVYIDSREAERWAVGPAEWNRIG